MADKSLYFWAIIPDDPYLSSLQKIKQQVAEEYRTYKALNSPPHITIIPPTHMVEEKMEMLHSKLADICSQQTPFDIQLYGFGRFGERTLYIQAELSSELESFFEKTREVYKNEGFSMDHKTFTPHLTLANRDISLTQFKKAWEDLKDKDYRLRFPAQGLHCLKHNGEEWDVTEVFSFIDVKPDH